jgi:hypothetical protein
MVKLNLWRGVGKKMVSNLGWTNLMGCVAKSQNLKGVCLKRKRHVEIRSRFID